MKKNILFISYFFLVFVVQAQQKTKLNGYYEQAFSSSPYEYLNLNLQQIVNLYGGLEYTFFSSKTEQQVLAKNKVQQIIVTHTTMQDFEQKMSYNKNGQIIQEGYLGGDTTTWLYDQENRLLNKTMKKGEKYVEIIDFIVENGYLHIKHQDFRFAILIKQNDGTTKSYYNKQDVYFNKDSIFYIDSTVNPLYTSTITALVKIQAQNKRLEINSLPQNQEVFDIIYNPQNQIHAVFSTCLTQTSSKVSKYSYNAKNQLVKKECIANSWADNSEIRFFYRKNKQLKKEIWKQNIQIIDGLEDDVAVILSTSCYNKKGFCKYEKTIWLSANGKKKVKTFKTKYHYNKQGLLLKKVTKGFVKKQQTQEETISYKYVFFP